MYFELLIFFRQVHAVSPDESSIASPVRLKRYEGFEHGLNVMGRSRGGPYRTKSPPVKKTKRKETIDFGPPPTPNEKKVSTESNDRYIFLGIYQIVDSMKYLKHQQDTYQLYFRKSI